MLQPFISVKTHTAFSEHFKDLPPSRSLFEIPVNLSGIFLYCRVVVSIIYFSLKRIENENEKINEGRTIRYVKFKRHNFTLSLL